LYELIILSLLISGKAHGYLIMKIMNNFTGPYLKFNHSRLYPLLSQLEREGFIVGINELSGGQTGKRSHRSFEITHRGRQQFHNLMMDTISKVGEYQKLFLHKVQAMEHLESAERLSLFAHYINFCQAHIFFLTAKIEEIQRHQRHDVSPSPFDATIKIMRHMTDKWQLELDWATQLREEELAQRA